MPVADGIDVAARAARLLLFQALGRAHAGRIVFADSDGEHTVGDGDLCASVVVHTASAYTALVRGGRGMGRAYADGLWDCDDLVTLVRIAARGLGRLDPYRTRLSALTSPLHRVAASLRANDRRRSSENVVRTYDLGNDFYSLVLDETMGYSCAFYERPDMDPVEASRANIERVCRLLDLRPGERLLELGSGWGGLAVHAAKHFGCHVSTVTLSQRQREYINKAAADAGVSGSVEVILRDYRDVRGAWDKIVSLEMVESVGPQFLRAFTAQIGRLLRPEGLALVQAITTGDRLFRAERYHVTFLNEYIFPGGYVPSLEAILDAVAHTTPLRAIGVYDITPSYPPTLRAWRDRLQRNWSRIEALGRFDEWFRRLWTLYFSWCEAGFLERRVTDRQILLAGPQWRDEDRLLA